MTYLEEIDAAIKLAESGRGTAQGLVKASPVQIGIYNAFTTAKNQLQQLRAVVKDAQKEATNGTKG
jgi:hypothetical protein